MRLTNYINKALNKRKHDTTTTECDNCFIGHRTLHRSNWNSIAEQQRLIKRYCNTCTRKKKK